MLNGRLGVGAGKGSRKSKTALGRRRRAVFKVLVGERALQNPSRAVWPGEETLLNLNSLLVTASLRDPSKPVFPACKRAVWPAHRTPLNLYPEFTDIPLHPV